MRFTVPHHELTVHQHVCNARRRKRRLGEGGPVGDALRVKYHQVGAGEQEDTAPQPQPLAPQSERGNWQPFALAASVVLAGVSTLMWWKSGNDAADLERRMQALSQPVAEVLRVPVPIMRSAGSQSPDVIVQKPEGRAAILLDIELGLRARAETRLDFTLVDPAGETVVSWQSAPSNAGRTAAVINSEQIPASRLWLQIAGTEGEVLERRLLEFRD